MFTAERVHLDKKKATFLHQIQYKKYLCYIYTAVLMEDTFSAEDLLCGDIKE